MNRKAQKGEYVPLPEYLDMEPTPPFTANKPAKNIISFPQPAEPKLTVVPKPEDLDGKVIPFSQPPPKKKSITERLVAGLRNWRFRKPKRSRDDKDDY